MNDDLVQQVCDVDMETNFIVRAYLDANKDVVLRRDVLRQLREMHVGPLLLYHAPQEVLDRLIQCAVEVLHHVELIVGKCPWVGSEDQLDLCEQPTWDFEEDVRELNNCSMALPAGRMALPAMRSQDVMVFISHAFSCLPTKHKYNVVCAHRHKHIQLGNHNVLQDVIDTFARKENNATDMALYVGVHCAGVRLYLNKNKIVMVHEAVQPEWFAPDVTINESYIEPLAVLVGSFTARYLPTYFGSEGRYSWEFTVVCHYPANMGRLGELLHNAILDGLSENYVSIIRPLNLTAPNDHTWLEPVDIDNEPNAFYDENDEDDEVSIDAEVLNTEWYVSPDETKFSFRVNYSMQDNATLNGTIEYHPDASNWVRATFKGEVQGNYAPPI